MAETPPSTTTTTAEAMDLAVFMETNVGTNLVMVVHHHDTVRDLKRKFMIEHALSFPYIGEIKVSAIKMKHDKRFYRLSELMLVAKAFYGCKGCPCLHVDATLACAHKEPEAGISADSPIGHDTHTQQERIPVHTNDPSFHPTTIPLVKDEKMVDACLMQNVVCNHASGRMDENSNPKLDYTVVPEDVSKQMYEKVQAYPSGSKGENVAAATVYPDHPVVTKSKGSVHEKKKKKRLDRDGKVRCISGKPMLENESEVLCSKNKAAKTTTNTTQNVTCEDPLVKVKFPCDANIRTRKPTEKSSDKTGLYDVEAVNHEDIISSPHDTKMNPEEAVDQKEELHKQKNGDAVQVVVSSGNRPETISMDQSVKDEVLRHRKGKSKWTDPSIKNSINNIAIHTKERGQQPLPVIHSTIVADTSDGRSRCKKKKISKTEAGEGYRIVVRQGPSKKLKLSQISARERAFTRYDF